MLGSLGWFSIFSFLLTLHISLLSCLAVGTAGFLFRPCCIPKLTVNIERSWLKAVCDFVVAMNKSFTSFSPSLTYTLYFSNWLRWNVKYLTYLLLWKFRMRNYGNSIGDRLGGPMTGRRGGSLISGKVGAPFTGENPKYLYLGLFLILPLTDPCHCSGTPMINFVVLCTVEN